MATAPSEAAWASARDSKQTSASAVEALTAEYKVMVEGMRRVFATGKTKDLAWRRQQLNQIILMIGDNHEAITAAVRADLGGGKFRGVGEMGAAADAQFAIDNLSSWARQRCVGGVFSRSYVRPEPKGVAVNIAPWNFPFNMCFQPLVPAVAAGNCMVIKPSEMAPKCAELIASLVARYLDPECFRVILGEIPETTALLAQRWDHIFYTGNGAVGRIVMAAAAKHLTPVTLELGGKSPVFVDETANLDAAVARISCAKWLNCGQICVAPDYVLVHESKAKDLTSRLKDQIAASFGKEQQDQKDSGDWGRIVNERHVDRIRKLIETSGGEVVCGGTEAIDRSARFVPPTLISAPSLESPVMNEEIFGPVLPIVTYKELDEAISIVTSKETPLALYVYSESAANVEKVLSTASSGGSAVNSSLEHMLGNDNPFGGKGASGMGSYHGKFGFDEFSHHRGILHKTTLPMMRGPAFPLPIAGKPMPDFVYDLVVKMSVTGFLPKPLRGVTKLAKPACLVALAAMTFVLWPEFIYASANELWPRPP